MEPLMAYPLLSTILYPPLSVFVLTAIPLMFPTGLSVGTGEGEKLGPGVLLMTNTEVASTQLGKVNKLEELRKTEHERQPSKGKQLQAYPRV